MMLEAESNDNDGFVPDLAPLGKVRMDPMAEAQLRDEMKRSDLKDDEVQEAMQCLIAPAVKELRMLSERLETLCTEIDGLSMRGGTRRDLAIYQKDYKAIRGYLYSIWSSTLKLDHCLPELLQVMLVEKFKRDASKQPVLTLGQMRIEMKQEAEAHDS